MNEATEQATMTPEELVAEAGKLTPVTLQSRQVALFEAALKAKLSGGGLEAFLAVMAKSSKVRVSTLREDWRLFSGPCEAKPQAGDEVDAAGDASSLDEVVAVLHRYVAWPSREAADAVALWIAATHAQRVAEHATRLFLMSPVKRCGKSRALDLVAALSRRVLIAANLSPAALYRSMSEADPLTVVLDEADAIFKGNRTASEGREDLRGLLNAGFGRNRPVPRYNVDTRQVESFPTFAMVALAAIGRLPDTIEDRAVIIRLQRRAAGEEVAGLRQRDLAALKPLRARLAGWIGAHLKDLELADPVLPVADRAADCWMPLVAIADLAGGTWPERARIACLKLTGNADEDDSAGIMLLQDLATFYADRADGFAPTAAILDYLNTLEERPWPDWNGRPLTARNLARLLKPFNVERTTQRTTLQGLAKGYVFAGALAEAVQRYATPSVTRVTTVTATQNAVQHVQAVVTDKKHVSVTTVTEPKPLPTVTDVTDVPKISVTTEAPSQTLQLAGVTDVTDVTDVLGNKEAVPSPPRAKPPLTLAPDGACPKCGEAKNLWRSGSGRRECRECRHTWVARDSAPTAPGSGAPWDAVEL